MRLGWCASLAQADLVKRAGCDYLEPPLADLALAGACDLAAAKRMVDASPLPLPVFNTFFPRDMRVVGEGIDKTGIQAYLARAAELLHHAGARAAVLGSAWSRNLSPGFSRAEAERQLLESYRWTAEAFAGSGVRIGIEAQNRKEANIVITLAEAVAYARAVARPDVLGVTVDLYHMQEEGESLSQLDELEGWIVHVQLADSGRRHPGTGHYDYPAFFRHLRRGGYDGTVSVECTMPVGEQAMRDSLAVLRRTELSLD